MATKRQDELEVAAVAGDSASEFAFVTDPHIDRTDVAADTDASKEVALLLTRRDDVEAVLGVAIEEAGEPGRVASEAVAIANVEFWNHAADLSCPLQAAGEEAVVGLGAVDRQGRAIAVVLGEPIELGVDIVVVEVRVRTEVGLSENRAPPWRPAVHMRMSGLPVGRAKNVAPGARLTKLIWRSELPFSEL